MLHRRATSSAPSGSSSGSVSSPNLPTNLNKTYTPLRRPSQNLYPTPNSGPKARYTLPSPSPNYLHAGQGQGTYFQQPTGGSVDLNDELGLGDGMGWTQVVKSGVERFGMGMRDGMKLDRSLTLVWGDRELRTLVLKSTLINLLSLLLLSLSPIIFSPILASNPSAQSRTKEIGMWYNLLLSWPVFATCFWINASWSPHISKRAQTLLHPSYRHQPGSSPMSAPSSSTTGASPIAWLVKAISRLLLIIDFTFVSKCLGLIPLVGKVLAMGYMCVIDSYYFFDWTFTSRGMSLERRVAYMQDRLAYMAGFGVVVTFLTSFGPTLVNMAIFALLYPIFVIQAIQSRPPSPRASLLPSTPSPSASLPSSPTLDTYGLNDPFFNSSTPSKDFSASKWDITKMEFKVPIFFFARYALEGLGWFEAAVLRDRGAGSDVRRWQERAGKRLG